MSKKDVQQEFLVKHNNRKKHIRNTYGVQTFVLKNIIENKNLDKKNPFFWSNVNLVSANTVISNGDNEIQFKLDLNYEYDIPAVIVFPIAMGINSPYPIETGYFEFIINDEIHIPFSFTKHNQRWENNNSKFYLNIEKVVTAGHGQVKKLDPHMPSSSNIVQGLGAIMIPKRKLNKTTINNFIIKGLGSDNSKTWFRIGEAKNGLAFFNAENVIADLVKDNMIKTLNGKKYLFGDIHAHSGESDFLGWGCGKKSREEHFRFARDIAGLDFFSLSEHDWQMNNQDWINLQEQVERFNEDNKFVTIHGYEWTSPNYGHRNVYFLNKGGILFRSSKKMVGYGEWSPDNPTPIDLWSKLKNEDLEFFTVPHHPSVSQFPVSSKNYYNEKFDRLIEIYSCWGSSENDKALQDMLNTGAHRTNKNSVQDHLSKGRKYGIICSSDGHDGHPGLAQGTKNRSQLFHYVGSGRVAVTVNNFERNSIYFAMKNRQTYGTTGEPILLDFKLGDSEMGQEIENNTYNRLPLEIDIKGTSPIKNIEFITNGESVFNYNSDKITGDKNHHISQSIPVKHNSYNYVRVEQTDNERAWSSPIWIK